MILLTGPTGAIGTAVRERSSPGSIISLAHSEPVDDGARHVWGDISRPRFGLGEREYRALADEVDAVINCAANVSLADGCDHESVNVDGTEELTRFAHAASARFVHVSTAWASPDAKADYPLSKWKSELVVREAGLDHVIVRPSIVCGDLETGRLCKLQGFHTVLEGLVKGPIRVLPGDDGDTVDFVPVDYVADVMLAATADSTPSVRELWLTSGPESITIGRVVTVLNELISPHDADNAVRSVSMETVERVFIPVFLPELPDDHRRRIEKVLYLGRFFARDEAFRSSADVIEQLYGIVLPDSEEVFRRNVLPVIEDVYGVGMEVAR